MSTVEKTELKKSKFYDCLPIILCGLSIPLSMFMWLGNLAFAKLSSHPEYDGLSY